jgi:hypothetical protein
MKGQVIVCFLLRAHSTRAFQSSSPISVGTSVQDWNRIRGHDPCSTTTTNNNIRKQKDLRLNSLLTTVVGTADSFFRSSPYLAAGLTCGFKASAADFVAQNRQVKKEEKEAQEQQDSGNISENEDTATTTTTTTRAGPDLQRNFAYIVYGAVYQGMSQEFIYNHVYPVLFGSGVDVVTVLSKVVFDLCVQTTLVTLPIAYMSKAIIYRYSFREAIRRYVDDIRNHGLLTKYFLLWGPVQCLTFSIIPEHFRVTFIAFISFFWLIILSTIASKTPVVGKVVSGDEECLLEDGQTCRIEG